MEPSELMSPKFSGLPKELRLQIWDATLEPKLLRVGIGPNTKTLVSEWSPHRNPIALSVCAESRSAALQRYTLKVPIYEPHEHSAVRFAVRYVDPERDLFLIDPSFGAVPPNNFIVEHRIDDDFRYLARHLFAKAQHLEDGSVKWGVTVVRRIALPRQWWHHRCSYAWRKTRLGLESLQGPAYWQFALEFFIGFREIYIIEDLNDDTQEDGTSTSECTCELESLLHVGLRADLQSSVWTVEVEGLALKVTSRLFSDRVRICDLFQLPPHGIDLSVVESSSFPGNSFFLQPPDVSTTKREYLHASRRTAIASRGRSTNA